MELRSKVIYAYGLILVLIFTLVLGQLALAPAAKAASIKILINGEQLDTDPAPFIEEGRVLVPLRALFEALGAAVDWDAAARTVTGSKGETTVRLVIGQKTARVNNKSVTLDVPAKITQGRTFVPLRFVGESLGAKVDWDAGNRTVIIATATTGSPTSRRITITDSMGRVVRVPCPPRRIISVNGNASELICAFGAGEKIVGISDTTDFPPLLKDKTKVGKVMTPNIEKIAALKPDLFIAYGSGMALKQEIVSKLQKLGIPVVLLDCYKLETIRRDVRTLGKILAREKEAEEYLAFFDKYQRLIESRTEKLPAKAKPLVYLELFSDYKTVSAGAGGTQMLEAAGGRNAAGDFRVPYPQVSSEWVLAKNPQVIIHVASTSSLPSGFGKSPDALKKKRSEIISRPGWRSIKAVQAGKVYLLSSEIYTGPRMIVGIAYFAKWLHPGLFSDVDPEAIHQELLKKFHGLEIKGAWAYPQ
ncbi:MAG: ABC transporter substrate-binding protein [Bacillota bacterium]|nr:ABC transporter substrate-binding protein [Bacillota bacterium]